MQTWRQKCCRDLCVNIKPTQIIALLHNVTKMVTNRDFKMDTQIADVVSSALRTQSVTGDALIFLRDVTAAVGVRCERAWPEKTVVILWS